MDDFEQELKIDFLNEATDLLAHAETIFMRLESEPGNATLVDDIFRFAHNLKGTSRAVGFGQIAELTHTAESLLLKIKQNEITAGPKVVDVLLRFNDLVAEMVQGLKENLSAEFSISDIVHELEALLRSPGKDESESAAEEHASAAVELVAPTADDFPEDDASDETSDEVLDEAMTAPLEVVSQQAAREVSVPPVAVKKETKPKDEAPRKDDETIRVSLSRLEKLGDLVGELVILQTVVERALSHDTAEIKTRRSLAKLCKDIQEMSMALRMVPVAGAFQKLQRIVRDTSKTLNKKVELRLIGEDTEIDRTVVERLADPLVHLVRNSVDHGIEMPADRVAKNKPEVGTVEVLACHEGNSLLIQITDDGNGMDPQRIRSKAIEKGVIRPDQVLSEAETLNLIFHPGFSTKEAVSEVSGRGVGMDVVKTNIEALGGEIKLMSKLGVGSCVRLVLPLTLAIIDGMLVSSQGQRVVIPRNQIFEINRLEPSQIHRAGGKAPMYQLRDQILPLFALSEEWGAKETQDHIVLIVKNGALTYAVSVEDVLRQQQVVVKPPTQETLGRSGVMGTTILGDGMPALIIDLIDLYSKRNGRVKRPA